MNWIQPTFLEPSTQPRKKRRIESVCKKIFSSQPILSSEKIRKNDSEKSWIDKYKPISKNELIVHKKKVEEVEFWLNSLDQPNGGKILLLTGPPGSGKLTTLKVLCSSLKIQLSEWITPPRQEYDPLNISDTYCSQQRAFEEYILRASRYKSVLTCSQSKRTVVVKDIPNIFMQDPSLFHQFLDKLNNCDGMSVVFIISDNSLILDLFPDHIKQNLCIKTINFNPITKKSIANVLTNITRNERIFGSIESNILSEISEMCEGDLRNAIMSLSFISTKGSKITVANDEVNKSSKQKPTTMTLTDPSIDLFHGLGRVLYVKRNSNGSFVHDVNSIVDSFVTTTNTFINMLQENYLNIFSDINSVSKASNYLCLSDYLLQDMNDSIIAREISLSVSTRGLMESNTAPIKRFQQFSKTKQTKVNELCKMYNDSVKSNFNLNCSSTIFVDSVIYLNKLSSSLENQSKKKLIKELCSFSLLDKF